MDLNSWTNADSLSSSQRELSLLVGVLENGLRLVLRLVWNPSLEQELQFK